MPHYPEWERAGIVPRDAVRRGGQHGFLGMAVPEEYGGGGVDDFRYNLVIAEEMPAAGVGGAGPRHHAAQRHLPALLPRRYCTDEQKAALAARHRSGELITAIAMTEPGIGSDLAGMRTTAIRDGDDYVVNGSKTFITNGINADLVITAVEDRPDPAPQGHVAARGRARHGRASSAAATSRRSACTRRTPPSCSSTTCSVPVANLLGEEGQGFLYLVANLPRSGCRSPSPASPRPGPRSTGPSST